MTRLNLLFICSRNQWRSPTAERIFADDPRFEVRSCGLSTQAKKRLQDADLEWADLIFVMEQKHRTRLRDQHRKALGTTPVHVLKIPDEFRYMDEGLITRLRERVENVISNLPAEL